MVDMFTASLLDRALYTYGDVDRLNGLTPGTGKRWLEGYTRGGVFYDPVLRSAPTGSDVVTWGEMVEARLLAQYRDKQVSLQRLRPAVVRLREWFGPYPLAHAKPLLDVKGRELVLRAQAETDLERPLQLVVVRNGQTMLPGEAQRFTESVDYADGVAATVRPLTSTREVLLDPSRNFGQPTVSGVRTAILAEDYRAGESVSSLATLYDLSSEQVEGALRFELSTLVSAG